MTIGTMLKKIFAVSNIATLIVCLYTYLSMKSLYNLMYPLNGVDVGSYPKESLVKPYWDATNKDMGMKIYLSTRSEFHIDFMVDEFRNKQQAKGRGGGEEIPNKQTKHDTVLLWEDSTIASSSVSRSFILTAENLDGTHGSNSSESFQMASKWLEEAEKKARDDAQGGVQAVLSTATAGEGIASTSVVLSLFTTVSDALSSLLKGTSPKDSDTSSDSNPASLSSPIVLPIPKTSSIWSNLMNNSTVHIHALLQRHSSPNDKTTNANTDTFHTAHRKLSRSSQSHNLLLGHVNLVKYSLPHHIPKPRRYLYLDVLYLLRRYVLRTPSALTEPKPWDMANSEASRDEYEVHTHMVQSKERGEGYPYWKPEVAIKLVRDTDVYPVDHVHRSGMQVVRPPRSNKTTFESGMAYLPGLHVDEIGLTSEKYIPVNATLDSLPLRISFDSHEEGETNDHGDGSGGLSPGRWRLLNHLSSSLESQQEFGFSQSDIDDVRRLVADTNVLLLAITILASTLHLLFEFLTFKNDVEFWRGNTDLTGLSVRALFMDFVSQVVILLFLAEEGASLLMTIPSAFGCAIALWKCQRGAGFRFVRFQKGDGDELDEKPAVWNRLFRLVGYELQASRLRAARRKRQLQSSVAKVDGETSNKATASSTAGKAVSKKVESDKPVDLAALSEEMDYLATRTLGLYLLLPLVVAYTFHTLIKDRHAGWYSWFITSASSAVYALGFVLMTPQLFLNYKLKSVAHLPWRVLGYRFVNTFIDDLFAFIIRMPTMARISCFRDDVVFFVYLWQRYLYPVDKLRPVEGGGMDAVSAAATSAVIASDNVDDGDGDKKKKDKKNN